MAKPMDGLYEFFIYINQIRPFINFTVDEKENTKLLLYVRRSRDPRLNIP